MLTVLVEMLLRKNNKIAFGYSILKRNNLIITYNGKINFEGLCEIDNPLEKFNEFGKFRII